SRLSDRTSSALRSRSSERMARRRVSISAVASVFIGEIPHFPRADVLVAEPTVDVDYLPGDVGGALRGQERDQLRYFVRLAVPLGVLARISSPTVSNTAAVIAVRMGPGATAFTVMSPRRDTSAARVRASALSAALLA